MKHIKLFEEFINEERPEWHDADFPDANGRFRDLNIKDLAAWLIKSRKKDLKAISGSLTQQIVFNRNDDPDYADKMEKTRIEVYKQMADKQNIPLKEIQAIAAKKIYDLAEEGDFIMVNGKWVKK